HAHQGGGGAGRGRGRDDRQRPAQPGPRPGGAPEGARPVHMKPNREYLKMFEPKLVTAFRAGYGWDDLRADAVAGLTVAIVALPLAMALAIASGTTPDKGISTAIIAGFLISALGGSRVQIGGPTAAFIPVVFVVIERFGYGGLIPCTLMAGMMLIAARLLRVGPRMRYTPP